MSPAAPAALVETRRSLHSVAEHVLSAARKRATDGEISLVPGPGGVRTPPLPDGRVIALVEDHLVVSSEEGEREAALTTVRAAAVFVGTEPGFPWTKHPPGSQFRPDAPLTVDTQWARLLADWFALADRALRSLVVAVGGGADLVPQIYPEHFDLAVTLADVNFGASPGDDEIDVPYLYVGPYEGPPAGPDAFWNAPFGAYLMAEHVDGSSDALAFFQEGQQRLGRP